MYNLKPEKHKQDTELNYSTQKKNKNKNKPELKLE